MGGTASKVGPGKERLQHDRPSGAASLAKIGGRRGAFQV
jgi:hypothetical protein